MVGLETLLAIIDHAERLHMLTTRRCLEEFDFLKGGTGLCDHLPSLIYSKTANSCPFSNGPFIVASTHSPVERVKRTRHLG